MVDYRDRSPRVRADLLEKVKAMQESQIPCADTVPSHSVSRLDSMRLPAQAWLVVEFHQLLELLPFAVPDRGQMVPDPTWAPAGTPRRAAKHCPCRLTSGRCRQRNSPSASPPKRSKFRQRHASAPTGAPAGPDGRFQSPLEEWPSVPARTAGWQGPPCPGRAIGQRMPRCR